MEVSQCERTRHCDQNEAMGGMFARDQRRWGTADSATPSETHMLNILQAASSELE